MKKILIVDDEEYNRDILLKVLVKESYEVIEAEDGMFALDAVRKNQFDLILLDIMMPRMDGFEFLEVIQKQMKKKIPIIVTTALNRDNFTNQFTVEAYFNKPFRIVDIIQKIKEVLHDS